MVLRYILTSHLTRVTESLKNKLTVTWSSLKQELDASLSLRLRSARNKKLQLARKCLNVFICLDATSQDSKTKTKRALLSLFNSSFSLIFL